MDSSSNKPWVSFCMSTYKRPELLKTTLLAIAAQTFTNFEVIISDNDPISSAETVVRSMNDIRFKYFHNGDNLGMIKSFNKSIQRASSEYIVMITDDDPVYPNMLFTLNSLEKENPGYGMYLGGCDWFCKDPEIAALYKLKIGTNSCLSSKYEFGHIMKFSADEFLKLFFTGKLFTHYLWSTCIVRKSVLMMNGGIPDYGTPFLGDYAYLALMSADAGCVIINKSLGCQTIHRENFGRNQDEQIIIAAKEFPEFIANHIYQVKDWDVIKELVNHFTAVWVMSHLSFLKNYKREGSQKAVTKEIFKINYMKKYKLKFFLKSKLPVIHDAIVKLKKND